MMKIRSMSELELYRQQLKYKELVMEKNLIGSTSDVIENFSNNLKDYAFELGVRLVWSIFKNKKK